MTDSLSGALKGAVSAVTAFGVAEAVGSHSASFMNGGGTVAAKKAVLHGLTRSAITKVQGGRWSSGFWSGVASSAFAPTVGKYFSKANEFVQAAVVGVLSGTVSQIAGGKFANGAVTGAFTYLFNYKAHEGYMKAALGDSDVNPIGVGIKNLKNKISQWFTKNKESIILSVKAVNSASSMVALVSAESGQLQIATVSGGVAIASEVGLVLLGQKGVIEISMSGFIDIVTEKGPFYLKALGEIAKASNGALLNGK